MKSRTRISVLIVEDEGIIAQDLQELLTSLDYDAFAIASSSEEAVRFASQRCPDVVLMDIRIRGEVDGIATAGLLRERFDIPIIYLTAHADGATIERAKRSEPYGYLVKPIRSAELRSAIEVACYKHGIERRLRARERWFSTTVRSIADAVITTDLAGKITFMNPPAELLVGMTFADAQGRAARDVLHLLDTESRPQDETPLDRVLRERGPVEVAEALLRSNGGPTRVIADSAAPVIDREELLGAVMVFRDVTKQKKLQKQLELSDRLASLGTMAAGVAHEINNPLFAVTANAELVLEYLNRLGDAEETRQAADSLRELLSAASRIARIVSDLGVFSRPEPKPSNSVDVRDAIEWAIRSTAHEFRHRARISTKLEKVPGVTGDEIRLGQVLLNLMINAAHAITPGNAENNEVLLAVRSGEHGQIVVEVSDTGSGMPPDVLKRIFEPFFTTKPVGVGTGLGLSICHGIVASMGGTLEVESRVGKGTTFRLTLPAAATEGQASPVLPHS